MFSFCVSLFWYVNCRLRDERGSEERGGSDADAKMRGGQSSPRAQSSNGCHSPVLNLSKSGNDEPGSGGAPSDRSEHSPNPSIHDDDDNISDGNVSEVDEHNDKDDDGSYGPNGS